MVATLTQYVSATGITTLFTTTALSGLANNGMAVGSAFTANNYIFAEVEFSGSFQQPPASSTAMSVWFLRAIDGTNYEDGTDGTVTPARIPQAILALRPLGGGSGQRTTMQTVIPPGTFIPLIKNDATGQAVANTGGTLRILPFTYSQS